MTVLHVFMIPNSPQMTVLHVFMIPFFLFCVMAFFAFRGFLRFLFTDFFGKIWDQTSVRQRSPNFLTLLFFDFLLIAFLANASRCYYGSVGFEMTVPLPRVLGGDWQIRPGDPMLESWVTVLIVLYPLCFLGYTVYHLVGRAGRGSFGGM